MTSRTPQLVFLKLGGSLITDKDTPQTARLEVLKRLAAEIGAARARNPGLRLLLGHGSGSFGHVPAKKYGTRHGVSTPAEWLGFAEVWQQANALNRLVIDALVSAGLPALTFPPSALISARRRQVADFNLAPLNAALAANLLPVVHGDVVFDAGIGGTIFSTEDVFAYLAPRLRPERLLLAGLEAGVWADYPACTQLVEVIYPGNFAAIAPALGGSASVDVTGGMLDKVQQSLGLCRELPGLEVLIFSALPTGQLAAALSGESPGTRIHG